MPAALAGFDVAAQRSGAAMLDRRHDLELMQAQVPGMGGPVSGAEISAEISAVEAFFQLRGARATIDLCPLADPGWLHALSERGYRPTEFNNVLVKRLTGVETAFTPRVRRALPDESDAWAYAVGRGFFDAPRLTADEMNVGRAIFAMPGVMCYFSVDESGEAAGGGASAIYNGLATLFADSTIQRFRRRGLHRELIAARLNESEARGCDLATASTLPGSASQRNYERAGFALVYTKVTLAAPQ